MALQEETAKTKAEAEETALQEEKLREEMAKAEAEANSRAEEAEPAALEAEGKAAKEAETRAADSALQLEEQRLQKLKELYETNQAIKSSSKKDYTNKGRHIARLMKQISCVTDNVRSKASDLIKLLNDPQCPQSISIELFAQKVVSYCENPGYVPFASGHVIVLVASQVPHVMDILPAEFHRACIYTVPKHLVYKKSTFESEETYFKRIGYREYDGKMESTKDYLKRLDSYMRVYGALVQTEIANVEYLHGLRGGWAWLARFLNTIPANKYSACSLSAFLQMAGFGLYRRYRSQFVKMLNVISDTFFVELKQNEPGLTWIIKEIQSYIEDMMFLQELKGRSLQRNLSSCECILEESQKPKGNEHWIYPMHPKKMNT